MLDIIQWKTFILKAVKPFETRRWKLKENLVRTCDNDLIICKGEATNDFDIEIYRSTMVVRNTVSVTHLIFLKDRKTVWKVEILNGIKNNTHKY